jgi:hypothetical protein
MARRVHAPAPTLRSVVKWSVIALMFMSMAGCGSGVDDAKRSAGSSRTSQAGSPQLVTKAYDNPPDTAAARAAKRACTGRTPAQVRSTYGKAAAVDATRADRRFLKAVAQDGPQTSVPLAARLYSMTVSKSSRADAFVACAHVLLSKESSR